jgi:tetratricopeptide (TPR) repeat protein
MAAGAAIAWMAARAGASARRARLLVPVSLGLWLCAFGGMTIVRNRVWADPRTLWLDAVQKAPDIFLPHMQLGEALHAAGMREQAAMAYRNAITLRPDYKDGYLKLGLCLAELKRFDEASAAFAELRRLDPKSAAGSAGLGTVAMLAGRWDEARLRFDEALDIDPRNVAARQSLAILNEKIASNHAEALRLCREIQRLAPLTPGNDDCIRRNRARVGDPAR